MTISLQVQSTYTRRLPQLEELVALAREKGLTDKAAVVMTADGTVTVVEAQHEAES